MQRLIIEVPSQRPATLWHTYSDRDLERRTSAAMDREGWTRNVYSSERELAEVQGSANLAALRAELEDPTYCAAEAAILQAHGALVVIDRGADSRTLTWPGGTHDISDVDLTLECIGHDIYSLIVLEAEDLDDAALLVAARAELAKHATAGHSHCHQCVRIRTVLDTWIEGEEA